MISMPIVTLLVGAWLSRVFEARPKLFSYIGFVSTHTIPPQAPGDGPTIINTHSVVIKNNGRATASNVRLGHRFLPNVDVYPDTEYSIKDLPGGGKEINFPALIPKKEITVNYLYFSPLTWEKVNTHIESDAGPARVVKVLLQTQQKRWIIATVWILILSGSISCLYILAEILQWIFR